MTLTEARVILDDYVYGFLSVCRLQETLQIFKDFQKISLNMRAVGTNPWELDRMDRMQAVSFPNFKILFEFLSKFFSYQIIL